MEDKFFIGLGILTVISGIALIFEKKYVAGVSGSIVGAWLIFDNLKKLKDKKSE